MTNCEHCGAPVKVIEQTTVVDGYVSAIESVDEFDPEAAVETYLQEHPVQFIDLLSRNGWRVFRTLEGSK